MGVTHNDVSVVTNVSADHLGMQGIDTVDQLAEVKAVVTRVTRGPGLGGAQRRRPAGLGDAAGIRARPWVFSRDPESPAVREALARRRTGDDGARRLDHRAHARSRPRPAGRVVDVPMTLSGLSHHNVVNALAAAAAALGLGIDRKTVVEGLRTSAPTPCTTRAG